MTNTFKSVTQEEIDSFENKKYFDGSDIVVGDIVFFVTLINDRKVDEGYAMALIPITIGIHHFDLGIFEEAKDCIIPFCVRFKEN